MLTIAKNIKEAAAAQGIIRAGGTDLQERLRSRVTKGDIVDISRIPNLNKIEHHKDGHTVIGALVTVAAAGQHDIIKNHYPALAAPAQSLATPQIRNMATMGGVLAQKNRCWYYRHPDFRCYKKGGVGCPAREGNHQFSVCFDLGPCVAPHPSSVGMALLTYDAELEVTGKDRISVKDFFGDGSNPHHDNTLRAGEVITHIHLPAPAEKENAAYFRLMSRAHAEWPLVEVVVRLILDGGAIRDAKIGIGGVATIPFLLENVAQALIGKPANTANFTAAAKLSTQGAKPLPQTAYKLEMVEKSVLECLEMAFERAPQPQ